MYMPYRCETAVRAFRFVVEADVPILVLIFIREFVNDSNTRQFILNFKECIMLGIICY